MQFVLILICPRQVMEMIITARELEFTATRGFSVIREILPKQIFISKDCNHSSTSASFNLQLKKSLTVGYLGILSSKNLNLT